MGEFLKTLRTLAEFPPTATTTRGGSRYRWRWYFRDEPAAYQVYGMYLSQFRGSDAPWLSRLRYGDVVESHRRLSRQLRDVVGKVITDG